MPLADTGRLSLLGSSLLLARYRLRLLADTRCVSSLSFTLMQLRMNECIHPVHLSIIHVTFVIKTFGRARHWKLFFLVHRNLGTPFSFVPEAILSIKIPGPEILASLCF